MRKLKRFDIESSNFMHTSRLTFFTAIPASLAVSGRKLCWTRSPPTGGAKLRATEIWYFRPLLNFEKCRPEAADAVVSRSAVVQAGVHVLAKIWWFYDKQWPNYSTVWSVGPVFRTFVQHLIAFCSRLETACDVMFSICVVPSAPDKTFHEISLSSLKRSSRNSTLNRRMRHFRRFLSR